MPDAICTILATDCGSTTTKAILIEKQDQEYRLVTRGEAPTTVEAPFDDVTVGVTNAVREVEELSGKRLLEDGKVLTERRDDLQFVHLSCGVRGLQIGLSAGGAAPPQAGTVTLNFGVPGDVEQARRVLESRGVVFTGPTIVIPGKVRLAAFRDPDGYRIRLAGADVGGAP